MGRRVSVITFMAATSGRGQSSIAQAVWRSSQCNPPAHFASVLPEAMGVDDRLTSADAAPADAGAKGIISQ
jgi:hypothetical protein